MDWGDSRSLRPFKTFGLLFHTDNPSPTTQRNSGSVTGIEEEWKRQGLRVADDGHRFRIQHGHEVFGEEGYTRRLFVLTTTTYKWRSPSSRPPWKSYSENTRSYPQPFVKDTSRSIFYQNENTGYVRDNVVVWVETVSSHFRQYLWYLCLLTPHKVILK